MARIDERAERASTAFLRKAEALAKERMHLAERRAVRARARMCPNRWPVSTARFMCVESWRAAADQLRRARQALKDRGHARQNVTPSSIR